MSLLDVLMPRKIEVRGAKPVLLMDEAVEEPDRKKRWKLRNPVKVRRQQRLYYRAHAEELNKRRRERYARPG